MAPSTPRLRVLSVGGNPLSAFLSWRLQATQSCDVTLVWKTAYETVSQYGISFKSNKFGNERFKPHSVVRTPEEAGTMPGGFDYVLLSVKALPDVYDLASIIESVVTPQHTCILVNTTTALGTEAYLESRYPTNVVLSLVSGIALNQVGNSEFEHAGGSDVWVGSATSNANVPESIQFDMAEALALTLASGNVDCHVSTNIRQQQWERVLGPIAFHPLSVIMETPDLSTLMEKPGCKQLITDLIDELMSIAKAQKCQFSKDFKQTTIDEQLKASPSANIMHQDYQARRPLEIETSLGSPIKAAKLLEIPTPRLDTLYPILHHLNQQNQNRPPPVSPGASVNPSPRGVHAPPLHAPRPGGPPNGVPPRRPPPVNGMGRGGLEPGTARRPPPPQGMPQNGYPPRSNGMNGSYQGPPSNGVSRRNSFDDDLEEFGHIALYGDMVEDPNGGHHDGYAAARPPMNDLAMRERELVIREREHMMRQREMNGGGPKRGGRRKFMGGRSRSVYGDDDDDDDGDFYVEAPPPLPPVDVDNFDMMSVTSRRNRRLPSAGNMRGGPDGSMRGRHSMFNRPGPGGRNRTSARLMSDVPGLHDPITDNPLMGYSSNRYGTVDRKVMTDTSRANSMTSQRMGQGGRDEIPFTGGAYPQMGPPMGRRMSNSPNEKRPDFNGMRQGQDPRGYGGSPGGHQMRPQGPNYHSGPYPHQVEQPISDGVSHSRMMKGPPSNVRSTTGSASASTNDSGSASTGGETSAHSSSSSLEKRVAGVVVG